MAPGAHAVLGASGSSRWMACPGSVRLSEGRPNETSVYAREGSAAHQVAEWSLQDGLHPREYVGHFVLVDGEDVGVTAEMAEAVAVYVEYARRQMLGSTRHEVELQMSLDRLDPPGPMYGTGDCVVWHEDTGTLEIIDYKHGRGVAVDAVANSQLQYYALAAVVTLGVFPTTVRMTIVQPRAAHPDGPVRSWEISWPALVEFKRELFAAAARTLDPEAELRAGRHCRFCVARAVCPAQAAQANQAAAAVFEEITPAETWQSPVPVELQPEQLSRILSVADQIRDWLDAVEAHCLAALDRGLEVPGWKLIAGRQGNRRWTDEAAAEAFLARKRLKAAERYTRQLVSPAQAERLLKARGVELPEELTERAPGKAKLVPMDDARPALPAGVQAFGALPETTTSQNATA